MTKHCQHCGHENELVKFYCSNCRQAFEPTVKKDTSLVRNQSLQNVSSADDGVTLSQRQILGFAGSVFLFVGVFCPVFTVPIVGGINYFRNGTGDGVIILFLALLSFFFVYFKKFRGVLVTGILSLCVLAFTFLFFHYNIYQMRAKMNSELENNMFMGLAEAMLESVQLSWGWAVLLIGAACLILTGVGKFVVSKKE